MIVTSPFGRILRKEKNESLKDLAIRQQTEFKMKEHPVTGKLQPNNLRLFNQTKNLVPILSEEAKNKEYRQVLKKAGVVYLG